MTLYITFIYMEYICKTCTKSSLDLANIHRVTHVHANTCTHHHKLYKILIMVF